MPEKKFEKRFKVGDQVVLVKPFQCGDRISSTCEKIQERLDDTYGDLPVTATVVSHNTPDNCYYSNNEREPKVTINFTQRTWSDCVYVNESCLDHLVTDDEVQAAIESILHG